jgi:Phage terminase large subunit
VIEPGPLEFVSATQEDIFYWPPGGVLGIYGGYGAGKTTGICLKALWILDTFPGAQVAIIRRTSTQMRKTTLATFLSVCPPEPYIKRFNEQAGILELTNGSKAFFLHLDEEKSVGVLKSLELTAAFIDQAEEVDASAIDLLVTRVGRWRGAKVPPEFLTDDWAWRDGRGRPTPPSWVVLAFNAPGFDSYLWERFAAESPQREKWKKVGWNLLRTSSRENKSLGQSNLASLLARDEDFIARYVDALSWGVTRGMVFDISTKSLLDPEPELLTKIMRTMKLHRSLDHGETAPTCCLWWATDHDGNIFVYREYYVADPMISNHRKAIVELSKEDRCKYYSNLADPTIFSKTRGKTMTGGAKWSVSDEYSDARTLDKATALYWGAAQNDEEMTRSRVREYLRVEPNHRHPITGERGAPRLYFVKKSPTHPWGCDRVIIETRAQRYTKIGENSDGVQLFSEVRDELIVDHAYDALKYGVASRPALGLAPTRPEAGPGDIYIDRYYAAEEKIRRGRRRSERMVGVGKAGYG